MEFAVRYLTLRYSAKGNIATCVDVEAVTIGSKPFAMLFKIWPLRDLKSRPPAHEARMLTVRPSRR